MTLKPTTTAPKPPEPPPPSAIIEVLLKCTNATVASVLTLAAMPQAARGHSIDEVIRRYKDVLEALRKSGGAL